MREEKKLPVPCTSDKKAVYKTVSLKQRFLDQIKHVVEQPCRTTSTTALQNDCTMKLQRKKLKFAHQTEQYLKNLPSKEHNEIHVKCLQEP